MKKFVKKTVKFLVVTVVVVLALALIHPLWLGPAAKTVANSVVPGMAGTGFSVGGLSVNAYSGKLEVSDVVLNNPAGYDERDAFRLDSARISLDTCSLAGDVVHVREIAVNGLFVSYVSKDGVNNFDAIAAEFEKGGQKDDTEPSDKESSGADGDKRRFVIDKVTISGVKVKYGVLIVPIPVTITFTDIGKESDGASPVDAMMQIVDQLMQSVMKTGLGAKDAVKDLIAGSFAATTNNAGKAKDVVRFVKDGTLGVTSNATDGAKGLANIVKDETLGATSNTVKEIKDLGKSLKDGVKDSFKGLKNMFKK